MSFEHLFEEISRLRVLVIGDVMLDTYCWGVVERISPEAPVPVVAVRKSENRIGGAGNVAINTASLGAATTIISVVGKDSSGETLQNLLAAVPVDISFMVETPNRVTTTKTRVMARNQQMIRLDAEVADDLSSELGEAVWQKVLDYFEQGLPQVCILEDYNKGVLTPSLITRIIELCNSKGVITTVDPKKKNFFAYQLGCPTTPTSIRNNTVKTLNVFPNPTIDAIYFEEEKICCLENFSHSSFVLFLSAVKKVYF